jgi:hypothetical protein
MAKGQYEMSMRRWKDAEKSLAKLSFKEKGLAIEGRETPVDKLIDSNRILRG